METPPCVPCFAVVPAPVTQTIQRLRQRIATEEDRDAQRETETRREREGQCLLTGLGTGEFDRMAPSAAPHKDFSYLYEQMSGKGESASEAHLLTPSIVSRSTTTLGPASGLL